MTDRDEPQAEASPEDLICLQSAALEELRRERDGLIRRLQTAEAGAGEKSQRSESKLGEALAQIEALKRGEQAVRARLEAEAQAAKQQAEQALAAAREEHGHERTLFETAAHEREGQLRQDAENVRAELKDARQAQQAACEQIRGLAEQLTAREAECAQLDGRLASAEEELRQRAVHLEQLGVETEHLRQGHAATVIVLEEVWQREAALKAVRSQLYQELETAREELDRQRISNEALRTQIGALDGQLVERDTARNALSERIASLEQEVQARDRRVAELEKTLDARAEEASEWQEAFGEREAELVAARDDLARQLAEEHSQSQRVREEAAAAAARSRSLEEQLASRVTAEETLANRVAALEGELVDRESRLAQMGHDLAQLRQSSARELSASLDAASQREAELVAARDVTAQQLAAEQERGRAALEENGKLGERLRSLEAELTGLSQSVQGNEVEWRAAQDALQRELEDARAGLASGRESAEALRQQIRALEGQLAAREEELRSVRAEAESASGSSDAQRQALATSEQHNAELTKQLQDLQEQTVVALRAQESMGTRIEEIDGERRELLARIDEMTALTAQLDRECQRLRRDRGAGEEPRKLRAEIARLEAKIGEIEQQHSDAAQRHSAAVAGYMVELNQRSEALHQRNQELQHAVEELNLTRQTCEDALAQLESVRQERAALERRVQELNAGGSRSGVGAGNGAARPVTLKLQEGPSTPAPPPAKPAEAATRANGLGATKSNPPASAMPPQGPMAKARSAGGPVTLIHLEENKALREPVREVLGRLPEARYLNATEEGRATGSGRRMLAVNLLNRTQDPLAVLAASIAVDSDQNEVFAYCADGTCGFSFGTVEFFAHPIDVDACVTRLLERRGAVQRLLAVSENVEMTGALREVLSRMRCSTSVAFDVRQAIDLLPMIKPDVVLVDFALPRGEGLRLVSRLRSDAKTRDIPLAVLLPGAANAADFRQHALRAVRESPMSPAQLAQVIGQRLGAPAVPAQPAKGAGMLQTA